LPITAQWPDMGCTGASGTVVTALAAARTACRSLCTPPDRAAGRRDEIVAGQVGDGGLVAAQVGVEEGSHG